MEIFINVAMVDVTVSKEGHDLNEREQKIVEVLLLNLAAHANAHTTKEDMAINPLEREKQDVFHFQFTWQKSLSKEVYKEFIEAVKRRYDTAFNMCDIENINIHFLENSYLVKQ